MSVFFTRRGKAAASGKMLGDYAEGNIVLLNESGAPVEFYVAKHDYEDGLNGAGRTLLVRKDCHSSHKWNNTSKNAYADSEMDTWLNSTYKALLDQTVQDAVGATSFYYTPGNGNTTMTTLSRSVFVLSLTEYGYSSSYANTEGSALPIASTLKTTGFSGLTYQATRTPVKSNTTNVYLANKSGSLGSGSASSSFGARPAFTLPSTALFDPATNAFLKG